MPDQAPTNDDLPGFAVPALPDPELDSAFARLGDLAAAQSEDPSRRVPAGIRENKVLAVEGQYDAAAAGREQQELHSFIARFKDTAAGYFEIRRVGPMDLPPSERGKMGKIKLSDLKGRTLDDLIEMSWGGGEYLVIARDGNNIEAAGGRFETEIGGDIKPKSSDGRTWLRQKSAAAPAEDRDRTIDLLDRVLSERTTQPSPSGGGSDAVALSMVLRMQQDFLAAQREERDRREAREREEREERRRREDEERRDREQREHARREADRQEAEARQRRYDAQLAADAEERKHRFALEMENLRGERDRLTRLAETNAGGGLGLDGIKRVREVLLDATLASVRGGIGGGADVEEASRTPESWGDVLKQIALKDGGTLVTKFMDVFAQPGARSAQAPMGSAQPIQALPGATTQSSEPEADLQQGGEPEPISAAPVASAQQAVGEMGRIASAKAAGRLIAFVRLVGSEIMGQPDPETVWEAPQDENGTTLAEMYLLLPIPVQAALGRGWKAFQAACPAGAQPDIQGISAILAKHPQAVAWMRDFIANRPTTAEAPAQPDPAQATQPAQAPATPSSAPAPEYEGTPPSMRDDAPGGM